MDLRSWSSIFGMSELGHLPWRGGIVSMVEQSAWKLYYHNQCAMRERVAGFVDSEMK